MTDATTPAAGRLIVLEGGEGTGKSRLQHALIDRLAADGYRIDARREPGGTPLGERIRDLINADALGDDLAELLLFEAARAHLVERAIRPALAAGTHVICDRFTASSVAYQSFGRLLDRALVERANAIATRGLTPDLTLLLDAPPSVGLARRQQGGALTHFDALPLAFHERVRDGYVELARESPATWRVIDAARPFEAVFADAYAAVRAVLGEPQPPAG
ncbi:MAG: dTMP kinase [Chloroflexota bacterium]|nr:dTMP kinase [Chloroflexota bacterium]